MDEPRERRWRVSNIVVGIILATILCTTWACWEASVVWRRSQMLSRITHQGGSVVVYAPDAPIDNFKSFLSPSENDAGEPADDEAPAAEGSGEASEAQASLQSELVAAAAREPVDLSKYDLMWWRKLLGDQPIRRIEVPQGSTAAEKSAVQRLFPEAVVEIASPPLPTNGFF
jgi:hypothetical protein